MAKTGTSEGIRVKMFSRPSLPSVAKRRRDTVAGRLHDLAEEGHITAVELHTWQKKVPLEQESQELAQYEAFLEWATETGVSLDPFFDTRECYSMENGQKGKRLVLPAFCIAIYRDEALQTVYPHSTNGNSQSVMDGIDAIESARMNTHSTNTDATDYFDDTDGFDDTDDTDRRIIETTEKS